MPHPTPIIINGRFLTQPITGVQRYARELVNSFDILLSTGRIDPTRYSLMIATPPELAELPSYKNIVVHKVGHLNGNLWVQGSLPFFVGAKMLFSPCNIGPVLCRHQVVTIHDASVFAYAQAYAFFFRSKYQILYRLLGRSIPLILTVSEFSKQELVRWCGIRQEKIVVIRSGHEHILNLPADGQVILKNHLDKRPYILAVSSNSQHKNFIGIVKAIQQLGYVDFDIVFTGGSFAKVFRTYKIPSLPNIHALGYVSDGELRALYENATCFIYPSFYEGFGLPPLEAMACGCPVIASKVASLPEVCGEAVLYCDPNDPTDIAGKISQIMARPALQASLRERGLIQAKKYRWEAAAEKVWDNIIAVIES